MSARSRRGVSARRAAALSTVERPEWYRVGPVMALVEPVTTDEGVTTASTADVYVYGTIGGWLGMDADDFVRDVASLDVDQLVVHLNSGGGDAMEGIAIGNVLRAHRARVVVRVDGLAASAASVIAMAGDEIVMGIGSQMMVHDPWSLAIGNAAELAAAGRMLDSTGDAMASVYATRAGGTAAEWRAVMEAETWMTAEEAVTAGLADRVAAADEVGTAEGEQVTPGRTSGFGYWDMWDSLSDPGRHDLSAYAYAGREHAPSPVIPTRTNPGASASGDQQQSRRRPVAFSDEQSKTMRERLGLAADADEQTIVDALGEALDERADPGAAAALPDGVVTIDEGQLAQLRASAARGDAARAQQEREEREGLVSAAVQDGRIPPARREAWLSQLEADPGAAETLASLQKGLVPVGSAIGHSGDGGRDDGPAERMKSGGDLYASRHGKKA